MAFDSLRKHAMDKDTVQISKQEDAKQMTTPATQGPTDAQHYAGAAEPVMVGTQDPNAETARGIRP